MALGPASPSSSTVSATAALTSSPTTTTSSSSSSSSGIFSTNGTPALILAFLAVGLFVGGMLAMFGLRRRMAGRGLRRWFAGGPSAGGLEPDAMDLPQIGGGRRGKKRKSLGKKPELWDVYVQTKGVEKGLWREIMPISSKQSPHVAHTFHEILASDSAIARAESPRRFTHFLRLPQHNVAPIAVPAHVPEGPLQVAVVITMPTPPYADSDTLDFTLGLASMPWKKEYAELVGGTIFPEQNIGQEP
ncbi:uncharacterized protein LAESUDRAFT_731630 [Laetiporus sulphureus 93-53]|uniref:Uncharacterized protein n=1 Tax=Laetiporus sulphureus 93-53 TaxID=1314785 RepID=A0A165BH41_9APHY|nr:uncharacterized protein LAESUDRAFT_731630 [Laetiporus sulphureus 93-53]KZT01044.1 hypothetical protein LAESUDRAFT_731630 [Laetiporus sulphureus 93-53]